jgi:hypothetical protein
VSGEQPTADVRFNRAKRPEISCGHGNLTLDPDAPSKPGKSRRTDGDGTPPIVKALVGIEALSYLKAILPNNRGKRPKERETTLSKQ